MLRRVSRATLLRFRAEVGARTLPRRNRFSAQCLAARFRRSAAPRATAGQGPTHPAANGAAAGWTYSAAAALQEQQDGVATADPAEATAGATAGATWAVRCNVAGAAAGAGPPPAAAAGLPATHMRAPLAVLGRSG